MANSRKRAKTKDWLTPVISLAQTPAHQSNGILAVDLEMRVAWCNGRFGELSGLKAEPCGGRALTELIAGPHLALLLGAIRQALTESPGHTPQLSLDFPATSTNAWFMVETNPLRDQKKKICGALLILRHTPLSTDTTLIAHETTNAPTVAQAAVASLSNPEVLAGNLRALVDTAQETILLLDNQGKVMFANRTAAARLGLTQEEMIGRDIAKFLPPTVAQVRYSWGEKALATNTTVVFEDERQGYWLENRITPIPGPDGKPLLLGCFTRDITRRKQAEKTLSILKNAVDSATSGIAIANAEGALTYVNQCFLQLWGYAQENEVLGRSALDFWGRKDAAKQALASVQHSGHWIGEMVAERKDGSQFDAQVAASAVRDESGQIIAVMASFLDVTMHKQAEAARQEAEERYRVIFEGAAEGIALADTVSKRIVYANAAYRKMYGYSQEELLRLGVEDLHPAEAVRLAMAEFEAQARGEKTLVLNLPCLRKDGSIFHADIRAKPMIIGGQPMVVGFFTDITERQRAGEALRESEEKYRRLYDSMTDALASTDMEGNILEANLAFQEMVGYSLAELRQMRYKEFTPKKWWAVEAKIITEHLLANSQCPVYEKEYRHKDGRIFPVELRTFLLRDDTGQPTGMWAIVRDISERRQMLEKLKRSEELLLTAFNLSPVMMAISRREDGRIIKANAQLLRQLNLPAEKVIGKTSLELGIYPDPQQRRELLAALESTGSVQSLEMTLCGAQGLLNCLVSATLIELEGATHLMSLAVDITPRKQAETALRESEARLRAVLEGAGESILLLDANGQVLVANPTGAARLGMSVAACEQRRFPDCLPQPAAKKVQRLIDLVCASRKPQTVEGEFGGLFYEASFYPLTDGSRRVTRIAVFARDITPRKRMELELAQNRERMQSLLNNAPLVFWALDREGIFTQSEGSMLPLLGLKPRQVVGLSVFQVYRDNPKLLAAIRRALQGETLISRDEVGGLFFDSRMNPLRGPDGEILGVIGVSVDVTAQVQSEQDILRRLEFERIMQEVSARFVGRVKMDQAIDESLADLGGFSQAGRAYLFQLSADEKFINNTHEWCAPGVEPQKQNMQQVPLDSGPWWMAQLRHNAVINISNVAELPAEAAWERELLASQGIKSLLALPIWLHGRLRGFIGFDDVTSNGRWTPEDEALLALFAQVLGNAFDRHHAEELLRESRKQLRALATHSEMVREADRSLIAREIHDDLGQSLTGLKMDLAWLRRNLAGNPEALRTRLDEMSQLIDTTINTVRRIASDLRPGVLDDLGLAAAIEWQAQEFKRRTGIPCHVKNCEHCEALDAQRATALFRILQEALTNVIRHAHATRVSVSLMAKADQVELEVRDNGRGITPEDIKRPNSLGLLGMRERARAFGGQVTITGRGGRGTTVKARMPLAGVETPGDSSPGGGKNHPQKPKRQ